MKKNFIDNLQWDLQDKKKNFIDVKRDLIDIVKSLHNIADDITSCISADGTTISYHNNIESVAEKLIRKQCEYKFLKREIYDLKKILENLKD